MKQVCDYAAKCPRKTCPCKEPHEPTEYCSVACQHLGEAHYCVPVKEE
jgi:hypothetical protein